MQAWMREGHGCQGCTPFPWMYTTPFPLDVHHRTITTGRQLDHGSRRAGSTPAAPLIPVSTQARSEGLKALQMSLRRCSIPHFHANMMLHPGSGDSLVQEPFPHCKVTILWGGTTGWSLLHDAPDRKSIPVDTPQHSYMRFIHIIYTYDFLAGTEHLCFLQGRRREGSGQEWGHRMPVQQV